MSEERVYRAALLERSTFNKEARTVDVIISTSAPLPSGFGGKSVFPHTPESVVLPNGEGVPLLIAHPTNNPSAPPLPVGRVKNLRLDGEQLRGTAFFSKSQCGSELLQDIDDGILTDVSGGLEFIGGLPPPDHEGVRTARQWRPFEVSLVPVGKDANAKILRGENMPDQPDQPKLEVVNETYIENRAKELEAVFAPLGPEYQELRIEALSQPRTSIQDVQKRVIAKMAETHGPVETRQSTDRHYIEPGLDSAEKFYEAATLELERRAQVYRPGSAEAKDLETRARQSELAGHSLMDLGRRLLRVNNVPSGGTSATDVAGRILEHRATNVGHTPGDFTNLMSNVANKSLGRAYEETPTTFQAWTDVGSLNDFKQATIVNTSGISDVKEVIGSAEIQFATMDDKAENAQLRTWAQGIGFSRQALINDDLGGLTRATTAMGRAQARNLNALCYAVLTANPTMNEDATALFDATHNNVGTAGAISQTTWNEVTVDMGTQRALSPGIDETGAALNGVRLNLSPATLMVPKAAETAARVFFASLMNPAEGTTTSFTAVNVFANSVQIISDAELDDDSATAWYVSAAAGAIDRVTVFYLNGQQTPQLESEESFSRLGINWRSVWDHDVQALDWRGLYTNAGA